MKGVEINKSSSVSIFQSLNRKHSLSVFSLLFYGSMDLFSLSCPTLKCCLDNNAWAGQEQLERKKATLYEFQPRCFGQMDGKKASCLV